MNELEDIAKHDLHFDILNDSSANGSSLKMKICRKKTVNNEKYFFALTYDSATMHALSSSSIPTSYQYKDIF